MAVCAAILASGAVDIQIEEWQDEIGNPCPDDPIEVDAIAANAVDID